MDNDDTNEEASSDLVAGWLHDAKVTKTAGFELTSDSTTISRDTQTLWLLCCFSMIESYANQGVLASMKKGKRCLQWKKSRT